MALTSLKYFSENAPEYDVVASGSLLGVTHHKETGFPVGKVEYLNLYPLSFKKFLLAMDEKQILEIIDKNDFEMQKVFKERIIDLLKRYCYIGGMQKAVLSYPIYKYYDFDGNMFSKDNIHKIWNENYPYGYLWITHAENVENGKIIRLLELLQINIF